MLKSTTLKILAAGMAVALAAAAALGAKVHLNDGRVLEGEIVEEGQGYLVLRTTIGSISRDEFIATSSVIKIERDDTPEAEPAPKPESGDPADTPRTPESGRNDADQPEADAAKNDKKDDANVGDATRVAILNFGPPSDWRDHTNSTVGVGISNIAFKNAVPMLEEDNVDVVIIRVQSGGGALAEMAPFHELFEETYERKFRCAVWVEYAGSCAAMSPYVIDDIYFMPQGALGGCVAFSGAGVPMEGPGLQKLLIDMEHASALGGRDWKIMRSMQIQVPLSADIDPETGAVTWRQDNDGELIVNRVGGILTLNAEEAMKTGFAKGIAATPEDLMKEMGITEYVWAGKKATRYIDDYMRDATVASDRFNFVYQQFAESLNTAANFPPGSDERRSEAGRARRYLSQLRGWVRRMPNIGYGNGVDENWFREQERIIRELLS